MNVLPGFHNNQTRLKEQDLRPVFRPYLLFLPADLHPLTQRGLSVILGRHNLYPIAAIRANCAHSQEAQGKLN